MYDERSHPLLAQVALTVSPFLRLPSTPTLPYTYKSLPTTLPPSSTDPPNPNVPGSEGKFIVPVRQQNQNEDMAWAAQDQMAQSPDDIIASCRALQAHLQKLQEDAEKTLKDWEQGIRDRELAEKRRVAPGWLDREEKILQPVRKNATIASMREEGKEEHDGEVMEVDIRREGELTEGEELDKAFGSMRMG